MKYLTRNKPNFHIIFFVYSLRKLAHAINRGYLLFEVNTKYISSSELKTSEFSRVRSTSENIYVFNSRDEIYLVFTEKKQIFFLFYTRHGHFPIHKAGGENAKTKNF